MIIAAAAGVAALLLVAVPKAEAQTLEDAIAELLDVERQSIAARLELQVAETEFGDAYENYQMERYEAREAAKDDDSASPSEAEPRSVRRARQRLEKAERKYLNALEKSRAADEALARDFLDLLIRFASDPRVLRVACYLLPDKLTVTLKQVVLEYDLFERCEPFVTAPDQPS